MSQITYVFAYGSNLDSARMRSRTPSARLVGQASLVGHDLRFHKRGLVCGTGKADAFATGDDADRVHGVVYEVALHELPALDRAESLGVGYDRVEHRLEVRSEGGTVEVAAWIYVALPDQIDEGIRPRSWYLDHVRKGAREHDLPERVQELLDGLDHC